MFHHKDFLTYSSHDFWQQSSSERVSAQDILVEGILLAEAEDGSCFSSYCMLSSTHFFKRSIVDFESYSETVVSWKEVQPYRSEALSLDGFKMSSETYTQVFLAGQSDNLSNWMVWLSRLCILRDLNRTYFVGKMIGSGSFSQVRKGKHLITGEKVAIKLIAKRTSNKASCLTEIELLRRLHHESIIKLHAVFDCPKDVALVLEYAGGKTLQRYIDKRTRVHEHTAKLFMTKLLSTIEYLHSRKAVHRDLKLENILLSDSKDILSFKVADFGLSCNQEAESLGIRCGSAGYLAPEIICAKPQSNKIDTFSAGVICFRLLSGAFPFYGSTELKVLAANRRCRVDLSSDNWSPVSELAKDFIWQVMSKDPSLRPTSTEALRHPWLKTADYSSESLMRTEDSDRLLSIASLTKTDKLVMPQRRNLADGSQLHWQVIDMYAGSKIQSNDRHLTKHEEPQKDMEATIELPGYTPKKISAITRKMSFEHLMVQLDYARARRKGRHLYN